VPGRTSRARRDECVGSLGLGGVSGAVTPSMGARPPPNQIVRPSVDCRHDAAGGDAAAAAVPAWVPEEGDDFADSGDRLRSDIGASDMLLGTTASKRTQGLDRDELFWVVV
jgi:hypothetical protein